jgi:hypothetical protein
LGSWCSDLSLGFCVSRFKTSAPVLDLSRVIRVIP